MCVTTRLGSREIRVNSCNSCLARQNGIADRRTPVDTNYTNSHEWAPGDILEIRIAEPVGGRQRRGRVSVGNRTSSARRACAESLGHCEFMPALSYYTNVHNTSFVILHRKGYRVWTRQEPERYCAEKGYYMAALLVTDIVSQISLLVVAAPEAFHNLISYPEVEPGIYRLEGVVSRKKQLLPYLTHSLALLK